MNAALVCPLCEEEANPLLLVDFGDGMQQMCRKCKEARLKLRADIEAAGARRSTAANNYFVRLHSDSPFFHLFPKGCAPVKQIPAPNSCTTRGTSLRVFVTAALCGDARQPEPVLWLDWMRCTPSQKEWLSLAVTSLRGGTPAEFLSCMDRGGDMPIRVSQTVDAPFPL